MKWLFLYFLLNIANLIKSQPLLFKSIDPSSVPYNYDSGTNIIYDNDHYFVTSNSSCYNIDPSCIQYLKINQQGLIVNQLTINADSFGTLGHIAGRTLIVNENNNFFLLNDGYTIERDRQLVLLEISKDFKLLNTFEYGGYKSDASNQIINSALNEYVIIGSVLDTFLRTTHLYYYKINGNGEVLNEGFISGGYPNYNIEDGANIFKTEDGGYIINYYAEEYGIDVKDRFCVLCKLDSSFHVIWQKRLEGATFFKNSIQLQPTPDKGFVVVWGIDTTFIEGIQYNLYPYIRKYSKTGSIEWQYDFKWPAYQVRAIRVTDEGDIIGSGYTEKPTDIAPWAWLFRISKDGKLVWSRRYGDPVRKPLVYYKLDDLQWTKERRIAATGFTIDSIPNGGWANANILLLVVDENGCLEPNCNTDDIILNSENLKSSSYNEMIQVYPNPVMDNFIIERGDHFNNEEVEISVCDIKGVILDSYILLQGQNNLKMQLKLSSGIYLIRAVISKLGIIYFKKIIVHE